MIKSQVSLSSFVGAIVILSVGSDNESTVQGSMYLMPFAGGLFLYLALCSLLPEMFNTHDVWRLLRSAVFFAIGAGIMALLLLVPHSHTED